MKRILSFTTVLTTALALTACANLPSAKPQPSKPKSAPSALVKPNTQKTGKISPDAFVGGVPMLHFKDYHAQVKQGDATYLLDSYVVILQQPFYIHVRTTDAKAIDLNTAQSLAVAYIEPRGCTEPLVRRADLDKSTADGSEWIIGVSC